MGGTEMKNLKTMASMEKSAKAFFAAAIALCGALAVAYTDQTLSTEEMWLAAGATLTAFQGTWWVTNA